MGYETDFEGELRIRPRLADEFVARFNDMASRRNNICGDGDEGSFDHLAGQVFGKRGTEAGPRVQGKYDNPAWTGVPSCWNAWQLTNKRGKAFTTLHWEGNSKFYNYVQWLQFVVDYIMRENQAPLLDFQGAITWNQGRTGCDDKGVLTLKRVQEKWKVVATVETPHAVLPMKKDAREFREVWSPFYRGGYCPVLLPGPRKEGMVEAKGEAVHADDPCEKPECRLVEQRDQLEVFVQPLPLPSLLHLCLSVAATNLARSAEPAAQPLESLPEELQRELRRGGRHCSGCGRLFWGPAGANVFALLPIMFDGLPMLGRYCSAHCWREEATDARARIDAAQSTDDDDDEQSEE